MTSTPKPTRKFNSNTPKPPRWPKEPLTEDQWAILAKYEAATRRAAGIWAREWDVPELEEAFIDELFCEAMKAVLDWTDRGGPIPFHAFWKMRRRVAKRRCIQWMRIRTPMVSSSVLATPGSDWSDPQGALFHAGGHYHEPAEDEVDQADWLEWLRPFLDADQHDAIVATYRDDMTSREYAASRGITRATSWNRLWKARAKLKEVLVA
jgi:DNA-directed RNA polymerase specialized sigma24 family protein